MLRKGVKLLIKKMVDYKKALVAILENTLENVNAGNTNITEEEASVIIDHLTMLNKGVATVSKAYACEHVLHITSNKFDYLVRKGIIPHGRKRLGFNELSWVLKDLDEAKRYLANNKEAVCENTDIDEEDLFEIMKDFHERLAGKHFNEPYAIYQVSQMYHTNNKGVKIDTPLFSIENAKKIYDRRIRPLNKDVTMWDVYVALNAQYHDNIDLYEKWFSNANDSEIEEKIIEATIANWFEDEDASSDKVWEYFRVI